LPEKVGPVWFRRRFHAPTGIKTTDQVRLLISTTHPQVAANLNGHPLTVDTKVTSDLEPIIRFEITPHMVDRNLLEIVFMGSIVSADLDGGLGRPVVLEIETFPA
jgi:hypothetical protein